MNNHPLLYKLNNAQKKVVSAPQMHLLVLAGAGSGKTRVLVHRIAWLIQTEHVSPYQILAVTFTNKAAGEMRSRLEHLVDASLNTLWVGTFHGLAYRLLRQHWEAAGLSKTFQIMDSDDQYRLIKRVITDLNLDETRWAAKKVQWFINQQKDEGVRPHQLPSNDSYTKTLIGIYKAYEEVCARNSVIDFSELILRSYELLIKNADLLRHYQTHFRHILVDEFQDTNAIQYAWLKLLSGGKGSYLSIVGDDDQSIYGWRGARIKNIQDFIREFPDHQVIRLEQNYRSTHVILAASNALITHNEGRMGKKLWTQEKSGELISLYAAFNELDEALFVVNQIKEGLKKGLRAHEIAILYRSNAQSRVLEEALVRSHIPYRIYGGLRFFERAEIKDALAYLRLLVNRHDDPAFERIINTPIRGIGDRTLKHLRAEARRQNLSLWEAALLTNSDSTLSVRAKSALDSFIQLINTLDAVDTLTLWEQTERVLLDSGLFAHYKKEKGERAQARIENLEELINATRQFIPEEKSTSPLSSFLAQVALEAGDYQGGSLQDCVQMMTLHSAKGLEFPWVFLCGLEEGLFPHHMSREEPGRLEEERRLCYVGMTRAKCKLYLSYAEVRRLHGVENQHKPSRFIDEIPKDLLEEVRFRTSIVRRPVSLGYGNLGSKAKGHLVEGTNFYIGQVLKHPTFGEGTLINTEGQGERTRLQVKFNRVGTKWLIAHFAKLTAA